MNSNDSNNLEYCNIELFYKDPQLKEKLKSSIINSPEESPIQTLEVDEENIFTYLPNYIDLKNGDCVIASIGSESNTNILYGRVIKEGDEYKIRYLDSTVSNNAPDDTIEHPPNNDLTYLLMVNEFRKFITQSSKSMEDVKNDFKNMRKTHYIDNKKNRLTEYKDEEKPPKFQDVTIDGNTISITYSFNINIRITKKTDNEIVGIATNGTDTYKYYYLYRNTYVEKIQNLTRFINDNNTKFYRNESRHSEEYAKELDEELPPESALTPQQTVFTNPHLLRLIKTNLSGVSKKNGGRRKYKRKATKKNKKQKEKNSRRSK
jgi:hypothetical protein